MSSAPASPESAADPAPSAATQRLAAVGRGAQRVVDTVFNWPGGRWPVPTVTTLFFASALIVAGVELLPRALSDVTLTVRARTEVLELQLQPDRTYTWWLPHGTYSLITDVSGCDRRGPFDTACSYGDETALTIANGATVRFELTTREGEPAPRFSVAITPRDIGADEKQTDEQEPKPSSFEVRSIQNAELIRTNDLITFESEPIERWRIPLLVERVQLGESLSDTVFASDALETTGSQPILTGGDVRMFGRALWFKDRYQLKEERFDPADVVQIPADQGDKGLLLGLLSLDSKQADVLGFDVTLHTNLSEVFVRRLRAEHRIGVSMWAVVSNLPVWLALGVVWAFLILIANYYSDRLGELRGHNSENKTT
jgi:hypothetical protein